MTSVTKCPGSTKSSRPRYLFLDFLRIFAMLLVFSFHLQVPGFGYGYLGVDIFFIISGFLITGIIVSNLNSSINSQWYKKFAIDRINRIIPPLIVTVFIATIFGMLFFGDNLLNDLSKSGLRSFYAMSNYYFYSSGGYFDLLNSERPLLHTWTLSVELKFYFLWMILFFIIGSKPEKFIVKVLIALITLSVLSALIAVIFFQMERAVFFLTPFRIYEFALGGLSFYMANILKNTAGKKTRSHNSSIILSLILCFSLYLFIDSVIALNISISFLIFILILKFAHQDYRVGDLSERIIKNIAVNTYSIYLVHYPVIIFLSYSGFEKTELFFYSIFLTLFFTFFVNYLVKLIKFDRKISYVENK